MKRSSPSVQFLVVSSTSEVTMSSRPCFRGGRGQWGRGYSNRPPSESTDQILTGDSHVQSAPNDNTRLSNPGSYRRRPQFYPQPRQFNEPTPAFSPRPPFYGSTPSPPFSQNQPFYRQPLPTSSQNHWFRSPPLLHQQQLTPRPRKPADYRDWEFAKSRPPIDSERFTVLSYNILADYLAITHRSKLYYHIPHFILDWEWRKRKIIFELGLWSADVLCFQEVDKFHDLEEQLRHREYIGIWKRRTGDPIDGCAIFWRVSRFKFRYEECIEFNKHELRDNVAQICVLELIKHPNNQYVSAVPTRAEGSSKVVICNIHVLYNPKRGDIKLGQIRILLDRAHAVSKHWDDAPVVICGDFNCTPKSPLYNFIVEQKLDLSKLPRDKVSGQASAEIRPQRPFNPHLGVQPAYGSFRPPTTVEERALRQGGSPLDGQNKDNPDDKRNIPCRNSIRQFQGADLDMKNISEDESVSRVSVSGSNECPITAICEGGCSDDKVKDENFEPSVEEFQREDTCSISNDEVALNGPVSGLNDCPINVHDGVNPTDEPKDEICFTTPMESHCEDNFCNETHCGDDVCITSSKRLSESNSYTENMYCNQGELVSAGDRFDIHFVTDYDSVPDSENLFSPLASDRNFPETSADIKVSYEPESINFSLEENSENLKLNKPIETTHEDGSLGEDCNTFLSELHGSGGSFPSELSQFQGSVIDGPINSSLSNGLMRDSPSMDFETVDVERNTYDPSVWTTMEIERATGNVDCTFMEHPLKLSSTYAEVDAISATRDANGEPLVTSYNKCFSGTVDYIWRSEGLQTVSVLSPIPKEAMQWTPGFPTKKWGSDHIALVSELAFTKDMAIQNDQVQ